MAETVHPITHDIARKVSYLANRAYPNETASQRRHHAASALCMDYKTYLAIWKNAPSK